MSRVKEIMSEREECKAKRKKKVIRIICGWHTYLHCAPAENIS
jgi:hypothetical protein